MRAWALALIALAVACCAANSAAAKPKPCPPASSLRTTIEAIQANVDGWNGRCVIVRGIRMRERLYSRREATLDFIELYGRSTPHSLVIYPDGRPGTEEAPRWVEITGRVGNCAWENEVVAAMQAKNPNEILMVAGYCHTSLAPYIRPSRIQASGSEPIPRFTEADTPVALRLLVEVPDATAIPQNQIIAARSLVAAISRRDEAAFLRITEPELRGDYDKLHGAKPPDWLRDRIGEVHAKFTDGRMTELFSALSPLAGREEKIFVERDELASDTKSAPDKLSRLVICWCRTAHCSGRWPVAPYDADNDVSRPYACVRTNDYLLGLEHEWTVQAEAKVYPPGLREPVWIPQDGGGGPTERRAPDP
jgi:hypothetical protein